MAGWRCYYSDFLPRVDLSGKKGFGGRPGAEVRPAG
jgi:hypothetical protein